MIKKSIAPTGRRHGLRARLAVDDRAARTVLTFESGPRVYHWTTDRGRARAVVRH